MQMGKIDRGQQRRLDQFYTLPSVAERFVSAAVRHTSNRSSDWLYLEPSAGEGAFFDNLPFPRVGVDISSPRADIVTADFLEWYPGAVKNPVATIGNPPFGKNSSLAIRFFNHAASFSDVIAFIVPKTFQKVSVQNKLSRSFHLVEEIDVERNSFRFADDLYDVPCVFQVWERRDELRPIADRKFTHPHFSFVNNTVADFAFQRVGARAGLVSIDGLQKSPNSHYFIKANICVDRIFSALSNIDWTPIKSRTAGNPSIAKPELIAAYEAVT